MNRVLYCSCVLFCWLGSAGAMAADPVPVGEVAFHRGKIVVNRPGVPERDLVIADPVHQKDRLTTGPRSFSVIEFQDYNKLAIRPNSEVHIAEYLADSDSASLGLAKGGLQATIRPATNSKKRRVYRFDAGSVKLDVEDARFDLRHCGSECAQEGLKILEEQGALPEGAVGRVATLQGHVSVISKGRPVRKLRLGNPVFAGDSVSSLVDSYALLIFSDGGRLVVDQQSTVRLGDIRLEGDSEDRFEAQLVTGGMRALTGLLGKRLPERVQYDSPVATTGVRGTGFDLICQGRCKFPLYQITSPELLAASWPDGLYAGSWQGTIVPVNDAGQVDVGPGEYAYVPNRDALPVVLKQRPKALDRLHAPRPDEQGITGDEKVHQEHLWNPKPGVYIYVHDGGITVRDSRVKTRPHQVQGGHYVYIAPSGHLVTGLGAPPFLYFDAACPRCTED